MILAIVLSSVAIVLSVTLPIVLSDRTLRNAFNQLESDFEELAETVRSGLGRISRLKRAMMPGTTLPEDPGTVDSAAVQPSAGGLSPRQRELQAKILSRRHQ